MARSPANGKSPREISRGLFFWRCSSLWLKPEEGQLATEDVGKKLRLPDRSRHPVKDDPHFADALRRRLEPAWLAAVKSWRLAGLCDAALDMTVDRVRVVQAKKKLLLLGFLLLLRGLCLLRFLRH